MSIISHQKIQLLSSWQGGFGFDHNINCRSQTLFDHFFQSSLLCGIISIVVLKPFLINFTQSSLLCNITPEYVRLTTFLINCSVHKFQRPLHRRNWAPPNIIAIIPCANVAEISNYLIFLYISTKNLGQVHLDILRSTSTATRWQNSMCFEKEKGLWDTHSNGRNPFISLNGVSAKHAWTFYKYL